MKVYNEDIKETIYYKKSPGGLDLYYIPKKNFSENYAILATNFGSTDNKFIARDGGELIKVPDGIAHFLEHQLFEEKDENISDEFAELGGDVNAFTGFNHTAYLFISTDNFYENLELLIKFVQNPYFTDETIDKERGIIEQEIKMYDDDPEWKAYFNCINAMYHNHPIKIDVAGNIDSIKNINKELLYKTYDTFYHPGNMALFVVGDLSFERILETVSQSERNDYDDFLGIEKFYVKESPIIRKKYIEEKMSTASPIFYIGYKDRKLGLDGKEEIKKHLVTNFLIDMLFGKSSIFYNDLYNKGLIDDNFGGYFSGKGDYGYSLIAGESEHPKLVYEEIINLISKPADEALEEDSFNRIKNNEIGKFIMGLDYIEFIANLSIEMIFSNFSLFKYLDLINEIEFIDVIDRFNEHFKEDNSVLSIINPIEE